jgi:hypothetical protein
MNNGMGKIISDVGLFAKVSCWTTILALAVFFIIWSFPILKAWFNLPGELLFIVLAVLAIVIFADQVNKRHYRPRKIKLGLAKYK